DTGTTLRSAFRTITKFGACSEKLWQYDMDKYKYTTIPSEKAQCAAHKHNAGLKYLRVPESTEAVRAVIASGRPVVMGIKVYESLEAIGSDGVIAVPNTTAEKYLGRQAVSLYGYNDQTKQFLMLNSRAGGEWGD
ncbi:hypothetical protein HDU93_000552, partial [Gonapodya sp. JEL0774]